MLEAPPAPTVTVAIDSYDVGGIGGVPALKVPAIMLSNSAYHIPRISSCLYAYCSFVLG